MNLIDEKELISVIHFHGKVNKNIYKILPWAHVMYSEDPKVGARIKSTATLNFKKIDFCKSIRSKITVNNVVKSRIGIYFKIFPFSYI